MGERAYIQFLDEGERNFWDTAFLQNLTSADKISAIAQADDMLRERRFRSKLLAAQSAADPDVPSDGKVEWEGD